MDKVTRVGAYALIQRDDKVLLCQLAQSRKWTLPGGGIEFGEQPIDAMIREVREETGFDVRVGELLGVDSLTSQKIEIELHQIFIVYNAEIVAGELTFESAGSTDRCAWRSIDKLEETELSGAASFALVKLSESSTSPHRL